MQLCAKFHYWRRPRDGDRDIHVARAESLASGDAESCYIAAREREPRLGRVEFETTRKSDDEGGGRRTRTFRERPSGTPDSQKKDISPNSCCAVNQCRRRRRECLQNRRFAHRSAIRFDHEYIHTYPHSAPSNARTTRHRFAPTSPHRRVAFLSVGRSVGRSVGWLLVGWFLLREPQPSSMDRRTADERSREFAAALRSSARSK